MPVDEWLMDRECELSISLKVVNESDSRPFGDIRAGVIFRQMQESGHQLSLLQVISREKLEILQKSQKEERH